ncbi:MAG: hypothetical protein GY851_09005 [bacterium]|nr:hypothetical protein [bacterium]
MNICILSGSPKGESSVTLQYVLYLQKKFPEVALDIHHVGEDIEELASDDEALESIFDAVRSADAVLWAFPVYILLVPSQLKRFIERVFATNPDAFAGKPAAVLTTSIHFCDHTAHAYMRAVCDDLDMRFSGGYSAAMYDLCEEPERARLRGFMKEFVTAVAGDAPCAKATEPLRPVEHAYRPGPAAPPVDVGGRKVMVVADVLEPESNLSRMVNRFAGSLHGDVEVVTLTDLDINGGCTGCCTCAFDNVCVKHKSDDYHAFYNDRLKQVDILIFASTIRDRHLTWVWKQFIDRSFHQSHKPSLIGKQMGFLISGPLRQIANLRQNLEIFAELQWSNFAGVVTDEEPDSATTDALVDRLASDAVRLAEAEYYGPPSFFGVGGQKVFRDEIWEKFRFIYQADHRFYKKHGLYDFPQKNIKMRLFTALMLPLLRIPRIQREFNLRMKTGMLRPLQKVIEREP